jgi:hypothetical protein
MRVDWQSDQASFGSGLVHDGAGVRAVRRDGDDGEGDGQKARSRCRRAARGIVRVTFVFVLVRYFRHGILRLYEGGDRRPGDGSRLRFRWLQTRCRSWILMDDASRAGVIQW